MSIEASAITPNNAPKDKPRKKEGDKAFMISEAEYARIPTRPPQDKPRKKEGERAFMISEAEYAKLFGRESADPSIEPLAFDPQDQERIAAARSAGLEETASWGKIYEKMREADRPKASN